MRDGQALAPDTFAPVGTEFELAEYITAEPREIVVGDKVKLLSFGSVGIVDQIKDGYAEVRVKALRFREKLENLELVGAATNCKTADRQTGKTAPLVGNGSSPRRRGPEGRIRVERHWTND